ncbi:hypothetical protein GC176_16980 [bacterium]|nr:hypothetical protein [bacterium]
MALFCSLGVVAAVRAGDRIVELRRFDAAEATQAAAVDARHFYAIANSRIGKYDRKSGELVAQWQASDEYPLTHLNSGLVREGRLYCAHSNYPKSPNISSVEIWDVESLQHVDSHSFGIYEGSLTWVDWHDDSWWAVFAHYSGQKTDDPLVRDHRWTALVRFDAHWRRLEAWVFPNEVLDRFAPNSCSGGGWGSDGALYCTGHDHKEVYRLQLPQAGSTLVLTATLPAPVTGQGIAWDLERQLLFGIDRPRRQVVVGRWTSGQGN